MSDTTPQSVSNGCRKYVKSRIDFNNFNTFINVNKIRKYLIHLLGGVTEEEYVNEVQYEFKLAKADELQNIKWIMESCYGQSAEEWCKNVYEYICERHEQALKNLEDYADGLKINQIEAWAARDEDGTLFLYREKPQKENDIWFTPEYSACSVILLPDECFSEIKWSDKEPTKVKITIEK